MEYRELYDPIKHGNEYFANAAATTANAYNSAAAANAHFANIRESSAAVQKQPPKGKAAAIKANIPKGKATRKTVVPARMTQKQFAEFNPYNASILHNVKRETALEYLEGILDDEDAINNMRRRANAGNTEANEALRRKGLRGGRSRRRRQRRRS